MKKKGTIILSVVLIAIIVSIRFYRKYERQRIQDEQRKKDLEFYEKGQRIRDSIEKVKQDSIRLNKPTRLDSMQEVNKKKLEEMKKLMKKLDDE